MFIKPSDLEIIKKLNIKAPHVWIATWFGFGFLPSAPGTWGSAASIPVGLLIFFAFNLCGLMIGIAIITAIGFWASTKFDSDTNGHDNKMIVVDEVAGQWITLLPVLYFNEMNVYWILAAFILFRLFDIMKPWPVSWIDNKVKGAAGVMGDDIMAGLMAALCLLGVQYYAA